MALGETGSLPFDAESLARPLGTGRAGAKGLFCGGTLAAEAQAVFRAAGEAVTSNAPLPGVGALEEANEGHPMIDLGADEFTRGRPHPMIDPTVRDDVLTTTLAAPDLGVVLLDLVIGLGAHEDPAGHVVRCLETAGADRPLVVASVTGTDDDPQNLGVQTTRLQDAGVLVAPSNADAAALAVACLRAGR